MNKKTIVASLNNIANELDRAKLYKESNEILSVMQKIAMPNDRNQMMFQEISETLNNFNSNVRRLEEELGLFNRVLRTMGDTLNDRRPDPEDIFRYKKKLQNTFEEIQNQSKRLSNDMLEIGRLSSMAERSLLESVPQQNNNATTSTQTEENLTSNADPNTNTDNTNTEYKSQRRPFRN